MMIDLLFIESSRVIGRYKLKKDKILKSELFLENYSLLQNILLGPRRAHRAGQSGNHQTRIAIGIPAGLYYRPRGDERRPYLSDAYFFRSDPFSEDSVYQNIFSAGRKYYFNLSWHNQRQGFFSETGTGRKSNPTVFQELLYSGLLYNDLLSDYDSLVDRRFRRFAGLANRNASRFLRLSFLSYDIAGLFHLGDFSIHGFALGQENHQ